jgi:iron-sulfur cluster assembly protein
MSDFSEQCPVVITPVALSRIRTIVQQKAIDTQQYGLRIGIRGGGCGGAAPLLGFDTAKETDHCYVLEHFSVFVEKKHLMYVLGLEIDFEDNGEISGFVFNQPQEKPVGQE